jgi:hypothetical protein
MKKVILMFAALAALALTVSAQMPMPPQPSGTCQTTMYCDQYGCRPIVICRWCLKPDATSGRAEMASRA